MTRKAGEAFAFRLTSDISSIVSRDYLVKGLIGRGTLGVCFGESGSGKSHFAIELAMAVAMGEPFFGHRTKRAGVLYFAAEGAAGVEDRIAARKAARPDCASAPFAVVSAPLELSAASSDPKAIITTALQVASATGVETGLIVYDTLARVLPGDENSAEDMGLAIRAAEWVRNATGATNLLVHHAGKDASKGARGHSCLRAAADTEILVENRTDPRLVTVTKQRDLAIGAPMSFALEPFELGRDSDGDAITSCLVRPSDAPAAKRAKGSGTNQTTALSAIREWTRANDGVEIISSIDIAGVLKRQGIGAKRKPEVLNWLCNAGVLTPSVGGHRVNRAAL